ncbi:CPBP family intramembrane glutamic endopeptidase [Brevibacterium picturae]|uniref:CAAX prenyl protease 2/Lysostaphin resistance protein A-like domain-containing protein n=1 Tax=Brevibacterium picturae TaxID=260553 RepID=A0ABN2BXI2_9MICO
MTPHYIRQFRSQPGHRWFSPLLLVALAAVFYGVGLIVQFTGFLIWGLIAVGGGGDFDAWAESMIDFNTVSGMVNGLASVILMWPAVEFATRIVYRRWFWSMISIGRGLRWGRLGRFVLLALPVWVIAATVMIVVSPGSMGDLTAGVQWNRHVLTMLIAVIVLVPFQAAAEEVVFRGLAMNIIGSWLKHPAWVVLIPVPFFVYGHLYDLPGLIDVGIFAVIVGVLTLYTEGLEAGMAFHIVNNLFALGLGALSGADLNATSGPAIETVISISAPVAFAGLVVFDTRRRQRRDDLGEAADPREADDLEEAVEEGAAPVTF